MLRKGWAKPCYTLVCLTVSPSGDQHSPEWSGLGWGRHKDSRNPEGVPDPPWGVIEGFLEKETTDR